MSRDDRDIDVGTHGLTFVDFDQSVVIARRQCRSGRIPL